MNEHNNNLVLEIDPDFDSEKKIPRKFFEKLKLMKGRK